MARSAARALRVETHRCRVSPAVAPVPSPRLADYDYDLPPELIAQAPAAERDGARLLVLERGRRRAAPQRHARSAARCFAPATCWSSTTRGCAPARLYCRSGERRRGRAPAARRIGAAACGAASAARPSGCGPGRRWRCRTATTAVVRERTGAGRYASRSARAIDVPALLARPRRAAAAAVHQAAGRPAAARPRALSDDLRRARRRPWRRRRRAAFHAGAARGARRGRGAARLADARRSARAPSCRCAPTTCATSHGGRVGRAAGRDGRRPSHGPRRPAGG